jgi:hypothetical protein
MFRERGDGKLLATMCLGKEEKKDLGPHGYGKHETRLCFFCSH